MGSLQRNRLSDFHDFDSMVVDMGSATDPKFLLNSLKPVLGVDGDIKTSQEVLRVVGMMKDAEKLMNRCIYLNVLRATCNQSKTNGTKKDTLDRFLASGGWGILNKWLNEYTTSENIPIVLEIMEVLKLLPVTISILKQGNTGKVVNKLTKNGDADVQDGAMQLIKQWKSMIRSGNNEKSGKINSKETFDKGEESPSGSGKRQRQGSTDEKMQPPPEKKPKSNELKAKSPDAKGLAVESFGLMNAMVAVASKPSKKKKKLVSPKTTLPLDEILNNKSGSADRNSDPMDSSPMREDIEKGDKVAGNSSPIDDNEQRSRDAESETNGDDESSKDSTQPTSKKIKKLKKSVSWAVDDSLTKICYFELDEEERAAMHHTVNFMTAKHNELIREREALENARRLGEDRMTEKTQWKKLSLIEMTPLPIEQGEKSREKYIQKEREQKVLADIFLTKASLLDSPAEPDSVSDDPAPSEPKLIPHDEEGTLYPKPSIQAVTSSASSQNGSQSTTDTATSTTGTKGTTSSSLLGDPTAQMLASAKDQDAAPAHKLIHIVQNNPSAPKDFHHPNGPDFNVRGGRPMAPNMPGPGFPGGPPRFLMRHGGPRPLINMPYRPRGNFRGRPMIHRGGMMRPRFHGQPIGLDGGKEEHFDMKAGEEPFRGRGRGRGGPMMRGRGKREPPLCRHFMTPTGCRNGQNCNFSHNFPGQQR